ncbi:prophage side tail fiber protein homolog StfR [Bactrocera dorsalis]|uniref:Prophage side tail fiber protein homolog StfR n=1 Tax=Bactrocera dorsalis TaxID=27457 RepID=A0A6I9VNH4_BACDO|nr:prophage side tail fiber protein homolog StfR [Bactrocera dorsalis]
MSAYREMSKLENSRNCLRRIARHDEPQFSKDSIVNVMEKFVKTVKVMDDTILVPCLLMDRQVGDSTDIIPAPGKNSTANQHTMQHSAAHGKRSAAHSKNVHEFLNSSELFNLYNMLKALKTDLLWTGKDDSEDDECVGSEKQSTAEVENLLYSRYDSKASDAVSVTSSTEAVAAISRNATATNLNATAAATAPTAAATSTASVKGHNRCPSTASVASIVSTTSACNLSDSESEISNENDSGMESESHKSDNQPSSTESVSGSDDTESRAAAAATSSANADKATELAKRCRRHLNGLYHCLEQMTEAAHYLTVRYQSDIGPV